MAMAMSDGDGDGDDDDGDGDGESDGDGAPLRVLRGLGTDSTALASAFEAPTGGQCGASTGTRTRPSVRNGAAGDSTETTATLDRGWGWGPVRRGLGAKPPT